MAHPIKISVIITTYNSPTTLELVLRALACQNTANFEAIIADDGSDESTRQLLVKLGRELTFPLQHVWQEDNGFRVAMIRNKAVSKACGDYLLFLDGDCVPPTTFVNRHQYLAEKGWFVNGNRILLGQTLTAQITTQGQQIQHWSYQTWLSARIKGQINRLLPLYYLPLGIIRKLNKQQWQGVKTCNLGIWKQDFLAVNGFEESYQGWGYEDSDLIVRLLRAGIQRKMGKFSIPVFHLWHKPASRRQAQENYQRLMAIQTSLRIKAERGITQYTDLNL